MENRAQLLFCLWRAWHLRNNAIHGDGKASVYGSARFVESYWRSLLQIRHGKENGKKGKAPLVDSWKQVKEERVKPPLGQKVWTKPPQGWTKLNVDAAYDRSSGEANIGIVMRDYSGEVLLSAWKHGIRCASVEDAEVVAGLEGVQLSNEWIRKPTVIESDCHSVVKSLLFDDENRASFSNIVKEIKCVKLEDSATR